MVRFALDRRRNKGMRRVSRVGFKKILCFLVTTGLATSCDKISTAKVDPVAAALSSFSGADRILLQTNSSYLLTWPAAQGVASKQDITYDIYGMKIADQTGYPEQIFSAPGEQIDDDAAYISTSLTNALSPAGKRLRIGTAVNKTNFDIASAKILNGNGTYLFQVRINSISSVASGTSVPSTNALVDTNNSVVVFRYGTVASQSLASYTGCKAVTAIGTNSVKVDFAFAKGIDKIVIFRDDIEVTTITDATLTSFTDKKLNQGDTYSYNCQAVAGTDSKRGATSTVTIPAIIAPTFGGITALNVAGPNSLIASWTFASGTSAYQYKVFCSAGSSIDWTKSPVAIVAAADNLASANIAGLGDEIPYTCGVRACAYNDVCESNTVTLLKTTPDGGAPKSRGITGVALVNGQAVVSAPWQLADGAVWKRRVYICTGTAATCGNNLANYALAATNISTQVYAPNTSLTLTTIIAQNTTYSFLLTDEDTSGNVSAVQTTPALLTTGDLTKPVFSGLSSVSIGAPANQADTTLTLNFSAILRESDDALNGASFYQIYYFQGSGDACASGSLRSEFSTASYTPGTAYTYVVSGLTARTIYSFCLKARDSAGNISNTTQYYTKQTQDVTAPAFDGIQGITYNSSSGNFTVAWNRSTSSDRSTYKLSISKNNGSYNTFTYTDAANPTGISFTKTSLGFAFADLDLLKIYVNACDDASVVAGGTDNCTSLNTPLSYTVPDVSPPSNFLGVDAANTVNAGQGNVTVAWLAPSPAGTWSSEGYLGFIVYSVDSSNNLTQLKDCGCAQSNCSDHLTSCTVTGLDPRRTYKFHVRAYDASRNITTSLNPATSVASLQTVDTTAPTFNGNISTAIVSSAVQVSWPTATDDQYAGESGATLTYQIYRKTGSNFASLSSPQTDADVGFPIIASASPYSEASITAGLTYYYTVCVKDASNNRTCAASSSMIVPPDITAPTIANFVSNKTSSVKTWNLSWTMSDNVTSAGSLSVQIYASYSAGMGVATTADTLVYSGLGITSRAGLIGRQNQTEYVNYLLVVSDAAGNQSTATTSVYSTNAVTITSITRNSGTTLGGKLVYIQGTGFDSAATVTIGGQACSNSVVYYTPTKMGCIVPAAVAGTYNILVTNTDGSTATASYTYYAYTGAGSDHICDNPTQPTATFYSGGGTTSVDPYLICTPTQFMLIGAAVSGRYFKMMDNLDVTSWNANNFGSVSFTNKNLIGNNMIIANWTRAYAAGLPTDRWGGPALGLFAAPTGTISDLGLVNINISNTNGAGSIGAFSGATPGGLTSSNLFAQGTVTGGVSGTTATGGLFGLIKTADALTNDRFHGAVSSTSTGATIYTGGLAGAVDTDIGGATNVTNCYSTGSVTSAGAGGTGGLFGYLSPNASATDVTYTGSFSTANVSGATSVGGLIGSLSSGTNGKAINITSSYATGTVTGSNVGNYTGGLIGLASGFTAGAIVTISNVYATGAVTGGNSVGGLVGGLAPSYCTAAGQCGSLTGAYATGLVTGAGNNIGGLLGLLNGNKNTGAYAVLSNSYATGNVVGATSSTAVGGLIGIENQSANINTSHATGTVTGGSNLGGLIGYYGYNNGFSGMASNLTTSYSTGSVTSLASSGGTNAGGLIGLIGSCNNNTTTAPVLTISQSYSTSNVVGISANGGFIGSGPSGAGSCFDTYAKLSVSDSYSTGSVSGLSASYNAAFMGYVANVATNYSFNRIFATGTVYNTSSGGLFGTFTNPPTVTDSLWDSLTTGQSTSYGSLGTGKTTTQMQTQATFTNFDFVTTPVWKISPGQYPKLNWQP